MSSAASPTGAKPEARASVSDLRIQKSRLSAEVAALNTEKSCVGDGECEALEAGENECGRAAVFLVVSRANPNFKALEKTLAELSKLDQQIHRADGQLSMSCPNVTPPSPRCVKGACGEMSGGSR